MGVTYEEFERAELTKAKQQQSQYASQRRAAVEQQIAELQEASNTKSSARKAQTAQDKKQTIAAFTEEYAQNALQRAVNARKWRQMLSDWGLFSSGLRQSAEEAAAAQKRASDARVNTQAQQAVDELSQKLAEYLADQRAAQQTKEAQLRASAEKEIAQNENRLYKAAKQRATSQYKAALSAAAKGVAVK